METNDTLDEAQDLAQTFVTMLRAVPVGSKHGRGDLIRSLRLPINNLIADQTAANADWPKITTLLAEQFRLEPSRAAKLWKAAEEWAGTDWPRPYWLVLREEMKQLAGRMENPQDVDTRPDLYQFVAEREMVGLAFSGGGIRSATFNLGVLQALAQFDFLPRIHYLSTVSGGGYVGAWFSAWMQRRNLDAAAMQKLLSPKDSPFPDAPLQKPIRFLRQFSNYLTPALGLLSLDTWTMAAVYLRNVILNQLTLVLGFGAILIVPRLVGTLVSAEYFEPQWMDWTVGGIAVALLAGSVAFMAKSLDNVTRISGMTSPAQKEDAETNDTTQLEKPDKPPRVQLFCVFPLLVAVLIAAPIFWKHAADATAEFYVIAFGCFCLLSLFLSLVGGFVRCFQARLAGSTTPKLLAVLSVVTFVTGGFGTALLRGYILLMEFFRGQLAGALWHVAVWGAPALLAVLSLTTILQIGLMGVDFPDAGREWLSRLRAVTNIYTLFWLALFGAAIYGPWVIASLGYWLTGVLSGAWIVATLTSVLAGKSARSGQTKEGAPTTSPLDVVAKVGPPVFLVGFVLVVALGIHFLLGYPISGGYGFGNLVKVHWDLLNQGLFALEPSALFSIHYPWILPFPLRCFVLLVAAAAVMAWRVDINEFSMHHFYKNRLVRCYLGASNPNRKPDPFIGFDPADDLSIAALRPLGEHNYKGPYHIINTTLNLSAGGQLAWQERKAASFIFSPCYSGFHLEQDSDHPGGPAKDPNLKFCAYRNTATYAYRDGIKLGTAVSISGAAADPNQGYNTSPAVAFLMTVFDVRLGWWLGNPRKDKESKLSSPRFGLAALISELFGQTDDRTNFVSLSDGGHFDNMGIYELIRRRCKYIVLCDAEEDGTYTFGGLGMAIRKCRIDFGAEIEIDPKRIVPLSATGRSDSHCAVGTIKYADGNKGVLVYIKSSLTGDEAEDVLQYGADSPTFPHESTADQWFSESQFESYRRLGQHAACSVFSPAAKWIPQDGSHVKTSVWFQALTDYWYPLNPALREHATSHTKTLNDLFDKMRADEDLHELGRLLFPGGSFASKPGDRAKEYFFCMTVLQLVEDIYFDFQLDRDDWKHDPRIGGWMQIFRTWKKVPRIIETWDAGKPTFRRDFREFWEHVHEEHREVCR